MLTIYKEQLKQKEDLNDTVYQSQNRQMQWQREQEVEGNIIKFELMTMKETASALGQLTKEIDQLKSQAAENERLVSFVLKRFSTFSQSLNNNKTTESSSFQKQSTSFAQVESRQNNVLLPDFPAD